MPAISAGIFLCAPYAVTGEKIEGLIVLDVSVAVKLRQIALEVHGEECACHEKAGSFSMDLVGILEATIPIKDADFSLNPGIYHFPFSMTLSDACPSSMDLGQNNENDCIRYTLSLRVTFKDTKMAPLACSRPLIVVAKQEKSQRPLKIQVPSRGSFRCLCVPTSKTAGATLEVDKNIHNPGDGVNLRLNIDNRYSDTDIAYAKVLLEQERLALALAGTQGDDQKGPKFKPKTKGLKVYAEDNIISTTICTGNKKDFSWTLKLPKDLPLTTSGHLHNIRYHLKLLLGFPGSLDPFISTDLSISYPVPQNSKNPLKELFNLQYISFPMRPVTPTVFPQVQVGLLDCSDEYKKPYIVIPDEN